MDSMIEIFNLHLYDITNCPPDWYVNETCPQFHRVYYIFSGETIYESPEHRMQLQSNKLYVFPVFKEYKIVHNPAQPLHCLWFHINLNHILTNGIINVPIEHDTAEYHSLRLLEILVANHAEAYSIKAALNVLMLLIQKHGYFTFVSDYRIEKIMNYIHNNYQSRIENTALANLLNIDTRYFIRLFRKNCGLAPQEYISQHKAFQAARFLASGLSVSETAAKTGFEDPKAFSRFFKTHKGISPSAYQKSYFLQP